MAQNQLSVSLTREDFARVDAALDALESALKGLAGLPQQALHGLPRMSDKSEAFCRQTLAVLSQNPQVVPMGLDLPQAQEALGQFDALRGRTARLRRLVGATETCEAALGATAMQASMEGYVLLKMMGRGADLDALRQDMGGRIYCTPRQPCLKVAEPMADC